MTDVLLWTELDDLELIGRGKVRDIYRVPGADGSSQLLIVTTDRISAFDVVMPQGIPRKGAVLTSISRFWFDRLADVCPHHLVTTDVDAMPPAVRAHADTLRGRTMLVHACEPLPVECVARGYLAGSGLKEYRAGGTVCGIPLPDGLRNSDRLPSPIFTPATKAETGHDENIEFQRMASIVGLSVAEELRRLTLELYGRAADFARERGVILADTKFEFGYRDGQLILIDEALTPDSSRYWDLAAYEPGRSQASFDKQPVRDWLDEADWDKTPPGPDLPASVVAATTERYLRIHELLTGESL